MRFIQIAVFILISFSVQAQNDSLAAKSYEDLRVLIGGFEESEANYDFIKYYQNKAIAEGNLQQQLQAKSLFIEALVWNRQFDQAEDSLQSFSYFSQQPELKTESLNALYRIGRAYFFQGIWGKSMDRFDEALKLAEETNDRKLQHQLLLQIGYLRSTIGDKKEALKFYKNGLELLNGSNLDEEYLDSGRGTNYYYLAIYFQTEKSKDSANYYIRKALRFVERPRDSCRKQQFLRIKADIEISSNELDSAQRNLKQAMLLCQPLSKLDSMIFYGDFGKLYLAQKEYKKAQQYLQEGLDIYQVRDAEEGFMLDHYKLLARAYKHTGDIEKSNFYLEKYINTTEEFSKIQDTVNRSIKSQEIRDFRNELNYIEKEKNQNETYFIYVFLGSVIIIIALLMLLLHFYRIRKRNEMKFETLLNKIATAKEPDEITNTQDKDLDEKSSNEVAEETKLLILAGLRKLEKQEYFLKQDCNSYNVAKKINTNTSYLSKVINSHFGKNFNSYINDLRINYAILRLKNDVIFRSYSIQSIAEEVGYKSADSFTKYFKLNTGLNPSFYIKEIKNIA